MCISDNVSSIQRCPSPEIEKAVGKERVLAPAAPQKKRKKIVFNNSVFVRETLHIFDYTPEEKASCWFNKAEMQTIKVEMTATVKTFLRGEYEGDTDLFTMRGLEFRTREASNKRKENKLIALDAVLGEQDDQDLEDICDPGAISLVYQRVSLKPKLEAHQRGVKDEVAVYGRTKRTSSDSNNSNGRSLQRQPSRSKRINRLLRRNSSKKLMSK